MWEIQNKLQEFRSSIRKEQIASLMLLARQDLLREDEEAILREIASKPYDFLTPDHLQTVLELANADVPLALVVLGNLVIDRFLGAEHLQQCEWRLGSSDYWPWVIHAFTEVGFCTGEMFDHCVRRIIARKSVLSLEHAIEVLLVSFKLTAHAVDHVRQNQQLVLALANHALDGGDRIPHLALTVFSALTSDDAAMPGYIVDCLGVGRTEEMLLQGLMKVQAGTRALACQVANNFLLSGIWLERVRGRLLMVAVGEKERVKVELSYYLQSLAKNAPDNALLLCFKRCKLRQVLQNYSQAASAHPRHGSEIAGNATKALAVIRDRFIASTTNERERVAMDKLFDEGQGQTIYEDESARMIQ